MPNIVYKTLPYPDQVEIHKTVGYFNTYSYDFAAFYTSDYLSTRKKYFFENKIIENSTFDLAEHYAEDLYGLFSTNQDLHILRTTDQALKCRWHLIDDCMEQKRSEDEMRRCMKQLENSLGTKAQLAMHLMKNYDKIKR